MNKYNCVILLLTDTKIIDWLRNNYIGFKYLIEDYAKPGCFCNQSGTNLSNVLFSRRLPVSREIFIHKKRRPSEIHVKVRKALQLVQFYAIKLFKMIIFTFQTFFENFQCTLIYKQCFVAFQLWMFCFFPPQMYEKISTLLF